MLVRQSAGRFEAAHGFRVSVPSESESAKSLASLCDSRSRSKQGRVPRCAPTHRLNSWCVTLLIICSSCIAIAISGCGGSIIVRGTNPGILIASPNTVTFGTVPIGQTASTTVSLLNKGSAPVQIVQLNLSGQPFSIVGSSSLPVTISAGATYAMNVQFNPAAAGTATGQLTVATDSSTTATPMIALSGTGTTAAAATAAALSALYCTSGTMTGSGTDACTVTLTAAAPSGGLSVSLSSGSSAVTVPSTVMVPANSTSAGFTATVSSVAAAQAVTMTASAGGVLKNFTLQLNAAILALNINATSVAFGDVVVDTSATQAVTLTSTGTAPVTISGAALTGVGFNSSGAAFPATLNPGQQATLYIQFNPLTVGVATGQLTITSNSSTNGTAVISLSGAGAAPPQAVVVAVSPATVSTTAGGNQQFSASVTGTSNTAVTWAASGTGCSGATCGTISSAGTYTAPAKAPSPATVTITATSVSDPGKSASATVTLLQPSGAVYYLAPAANGGNDSNNGLSPAAPWLSPNHSVKCGDVIIAEASTAYASANFQSSKWGKVSCPAGNSVAWLRCSIFDGCKIAATNQFAMWIGQSYWGVQGWEASGTGNGGVCFGVSPTDGSTIHHIILANNVANGCADGFSVSSASTNVGVDYVSIVGNIAWNAARSTVLCNSGVTVYEPIKLDSNAGTHIFIAGNFSFDNASPTNCNKGSSTYDGNGIVLDDIGNVQSGGAAYTQQIVVRNNIAVWNGGYGFGNTGNGTPSAPIYYLYNTSVHNLTATNSSTTTCGDVTILSSSHTTISNNLIETGSSLACQGTSRAAYAVAVNTADSTDKVAMNWLYSAAGNNTTAITSTGFTFGTNITGTDPGLANPVDPGQPNCAGKANTVDCMSTVIANYTPANPAAKAYGYQMPQSSSVSDPLFPQWLCSADLPGGLITMGCSK